MKSYSYEINEIGNDVTTVKTQSNGLYKIYKCLPSPSLSTKYIKHVNKYLLYDSSTSLCLGNFNSYDECLEFIETYDNNKESKSENVLYLINLEKVKVVTESSDYYYCIDESNYPFKVSKKDINSSAFKSAESALLRLKEVRSKIS